jgi:hypothetical protein
MSQFMSGLSDLRRRSNLAHIAGALVCGSLVTALLLLSGATGHAEDDPKPADQHSAAIENPLARHLLQSLPATLKRPLFTPSRRPPPPEPAPIVRVEPSPPPPPPAAQPTVVLVGTMIDAQGPQAILRAGSDNKDMRVRVGDDVSGWKIKDIDESHLTLALDDRTFSVALFPANANPGQNHAPAQVAHAKRAALHEREH